MAKVSLRKLFDKEPKKKKSKIKDVSEKEKKYVAIAFTMLAIFCIIIFSAALTPKAFQNDTFYTIKIGQDIRKNGIDYVDHYSWHENLPYMYPHWLYDVITSLVYDFLGGFNGLYIVTMIFSCILGVVLYFANKKFSKNEFVSFIMTMIQMYLMKDYIAARAQLVTFILFVATIILIEKYLEKPKIGYAIGLIAIPIVIANIHSAVFPFYFVLYLPYIGEYVINIILDSHICHKAYQFILKLYIKIENKRLKKAKKSQTEYYKKKIIELNKKIVESNEKFEKFLLKQSEKRKSPYKIKYSLNKNTNKLFIIMIICIFTGLLSPLKDMPYTYTYRIMRGNTTASVSEHLPTVIIENKEILLAYAIFFALTIFTKTKLSLKDWFLVGGMGLLALMSRRQISMLVLFGGLVLSKIFADLFYKHDKKGTTEVLCLMTTVPRRNCNIIFSNFIMCCSIQTKNE